MEHETSAPFDEDVSDVPSNPFLVGRVVSFAEHLDLGWHDFSFLGSRLA
jgi:hypothetical protein